MSDEVVRETTNAEVDPGQTADRPRKSRKRGKRNRSRSNEAGLQSTSGTTESLTEASPVVAGPQRERERPSRRSGGERSGSNGYRDGLDRFFCANGLRLFPREWPVSHRRGLAIAQLREVTRRGQELLICDQLHDGGCLWPDGEPATERRSAFPEPVAVLDSAWQTMPEAELEPVMDGDA